MVLIYDCLLIFYIFFTLQKYYVKIYKYYNYFSKMKGREQMKLKSENSVKILHCADFHIGAQNYYLRNKARERRSEILSTFEKIVGICKNEHIEVMLIAGDLFDSNHIENSALKKVKKLLSEIPDTFVAISAGNHDYITSDSPYINSKWPSNVHIFGNSMQYVTVPEKNVRVWGCSFSTPYLERPLLNNIRVPDDDMVNLMVMHGDFVSEGQSSKFNPVTKSNISYSGMDYVALGHIHQSSSIHNAGRTFFAYCGCPESQGFEETGLKGVYTGTVSRGRCNLSFRPVQYRICATLQCDITGMKNHDEIIAEVHKKLKSAYGENYMTNIYRVTFTGTLQTDEPTDFVQLEKKLSEDIYFVQVRNYTRPDINLEELSSEMNLKGIFVKKMLERINSTVDKVERNNLEKAMYLGLSAFDGEVNHYEN